MGVIEAGTVIGSKYRIVRALARGGMGTVYEAEALADPSFRVAIKILDPVLLKSPDVRDRFRNEVLVGYRVSHPNIIAMYEFFELGDCQAFAMELVEGPSLADTIKERPLSFGVCVERLLDLVSALEALRREGIVHRDVKPDNILLHANRTLKLTDFGISRIPGVGYSEGTDLRVGTATYLGPEYLERGEFDHRTDIYALGLVAYEMLTGELPFASEDPQALLQEKLDRAGRDLERKVPGLPEEFLQFVYRCLDPDPAARYQKAEHIELWLSPFAQQQGIRASKTKGARERVPLADLLSAPVSEERHA